MTYEMIKLDISDRIATLTLNRPERLNAAPPPMFDEIGAALDALGDARVLLITGEGRAFCSGADLAIKAEAGGQSISGGQGAYRALTRSYNPTLAKLAKLPIPVITAVNGPAAGVGCSLGLMGDFVLVAKSGYFLQAFVNIGLVPDGGSTWLLPRLVGKARATRMMMLGEKIYGPQAEEWGMVYKCVEDVDLHAEAQALAAKLSAGPTLAYGLIRQGIADALETGYSSSLVMEAQNQNIAGDSEDAIIGAVAFLTKEKAQFKGK